MLLHSKIGRAVRIDASNRSALRRKGLTQLAALHRSKDCWRLKIWLVPPQIVLRALRSTTTTAAILHGPSQPSASGRDSFLYTIRRYEAACWAVRGDLRCCTCQPSLALPRIALLIRLTQLVFSMLKYLGWGTSWHHVKFICSTSGIDNNLTHSLLESSLSTCI